uniref:ZnMc domain-containing protein n=1 Tax=Parastrongyloides trichosuri TaxID=131310 RepID=A0A0N4ZCV0_PARTI
MKNNIIFILLISLSSSTYAGIYNDTKHRWNIPIYYKIEANATQYNETVRKGFDLIQNFTCLNFTEKSSLSISESGITFLQLGDNCYSDYIGKKEDNTTNLIYLGKNCRGNPVFIASLVAQVLGMFPEQTRHDRSSYVSINYTNIKTNTNLTFFNISDSRVTSDYNTFYDYGSTLHYFSKSFANDTKYNTINVTGKYSDRYQLMLGQKNTVTFGILKLLFSRYCNDSIIRGKGDSSEEEEETWCPNGGYPNPKNKSACVCPYPFGSDCATIIGDEDCSKRIILTEKEQSYTNEGSKVCNTLFIAPSNKKLNFTLVNLSSKDQTPCARASSMLEVKYKNSTEPMGLCFCGKINKQYSITTEGPNLYVLYNGGQQTDKVTYKVQVIEPKKKSNNTKQKTKKTKKS